ncbi:hypothetical protein [Streptomyces aureoversilis]|uniref:Uncharacterized protein n=1 Tax=Streptomyces aureoversilis TaxID=67277 RepID=A0ABW0ADA1_9ACTN
MATLKVTAILFALTAMAGSGAPIASADDSDSHRKSRVIDQKVIEVSKRDGSAGNDRMVIDRYFSNYSSVTSVINQNGTFNVAAENMCIDLLGILAPDRCSSSR